MTRIGIAEELCCDCVHYFDECNDNELHRGMKNNHVNGFSCKNHEKYDRETCRNCKQGSNDVGEINYHHTVKKYLCTQCSISLEE